MGPRDLHLLSEELSNRLANETVQHDTIELCGPGPLQLLHCNPDEVLELARLQLHASPFSQVGVCWRRLYEEATLWKAALLLRAHAHSSRLDAGVQDAVRHGLDRVDEDWLAKIVAVLDMGLIIVGAPGRRELFDWLFEQLQKFAPVDFDTLRAFPVTAIPLHSFPEPSAILRAEHCLDIDEFQQHLQLNGKPLLISDTMTHWPAIERWKDPNYFLHMTVGGRRIIPVEIGSSYTDADWTQTTMSFREWCSTYLLNEQQDHKGYLAQHDLFEQIPALRKDIVTPDYCYTSPPEPKGAAAFTFGLSSIPALDEPIVNAWIGPKGTKTPLHTDAYHNILCQAVGYKYVRLYAPEHTADVRPLGIDDKGVDMSNTASADLDELDARGIPHVQGILAPGDCLYIPLGWWHYVESLSVSASVSFWWN